jgi:putative membrane protein
MFGGFCGTSNSYWGYSGKFGVWGWIGLILNLIYWIGLIAGIIFLVLWAIRRRGALIANRQPAAKESLQAQYARGEITREQYEIKKQEL